MPQGKRQPMRKCIGCCKMFNKNQLIRITKGADGKIFFDDTGKSQGRGAYICRNPECLKKAEKSKAIQRAFRGFAAPELYEKLYCEISEGVPNE